VSSVLLLQASSAFFLNASFAWLMGSLLARRWIILAGAAESDGEAAVRRNDLVAAVVCALASIGGLWAATAVMGGVSLVDAKPLFWAMVTTTDYGRAGCLSTVAVIAVPVVRATPTIGAARELLTFAGLAIFAATRASMGHAGEEGLLTAAMASELMHLIAIGVWAGVVFVSAWVAVGNSNLAFSLKATSRYLEYMSQAAMAAVFVILSTGMYNAWLRIGTPENLSHGAYAGAFLVKVSLVGVALLLGGYNKFFGMRQASESDLGVQRVKFVLQCESILLLGVLIAAAVMTSQEPPAAM
jgi:putative copper resistance protein D